MAPDILPPPSAPAGYRHTLPLTVSPRVLRWVPPVSLILVLILSFFNWAGLYPGGYGLFTQNGWQTAFGSWSPDKLLKEKGIQGGSVMGRFYEVEDDTIMLKDDKPGASVLMIFVIILLCIAVLLGIAFIVFNLLPPRTAPFIDVLKAWQGLILGGLALLMFLFLVIELLIGFNSERVVAKVVDERFKTAREEADTPEKKTVLEVARGASLDALGLRHTFWFRLAFWLIFIAALCGFLEFWGTRRGNRPLPKLEFVW
jgi:hypothetical protein